jgi:hypothetical protein
MKTMKTTTSKVLHVTMEDDDTFRRMKAMAALRDMTIPEFVTSALVQVVAQCEEEYLISRYEQRLTDSHKRKPIVPRPRIEE